jgi:ATP-dependent RNA helicase DDX6/DHH1
LKRELLLGIYEKGYENPSPIQEEAIPAALAGKDILARAKNGTGKTASFLIPALEKVDITKNIVQGLIWISPNEMQLWFSFPPENLRYKHRKCVKNLENTSKLKLWSQLEEHP